MIDSKRINIITALALCIVILITTVLLALAGNGTVAATTTPQYTTQLFGTDIISIDIIVSQSDWDNMIKNATAEEYIMVDVVVNGAKFSNVGIRPKGNSSLSQVARDDTSDRYSFRLKFDEYIKDQTCFGLDTFVINNMISDNSYMKEYLSYDIMNFIGVDTPYLGFTNVSVNGETWGLYLAIEAYSDSFLERTYGDITGNLYNVKSMDSSLTDSKNSPPNRMPSKNNLNGGRRSNGGDLKYTDDNSSSYSAIFNNAVGKTDESDHQRVITALKNLSTGTDLETYFDVDKILRYLAAHAVVVNLDSYSSNMAQNYYIYEEDGTLTILPWDYNMAFGGFQSGTIEDVINFPIDTPVSGVDLMERPLIAKLLENENYLERYHNYLNEIVTLYFESGQFENKITELEGLIGDYVKNDPTAFCTYEDYKKAVEGLKELGQLRAESISGQLKGLIPSTTTGQSSNPETLISTQSVTLNDLGSHMGKNRDELKDTMNKSPLDPDSNSEMPDMLDRQIMEQVIQIIQDTPMNDLTEDQKSQLLNIGLTEEQVDMLVNFGPGQRMPDPNREFTPDRTMESNNNTEKVNILVTISLLTILSLGTLGMTRYKRTF